MTNFRLGNIEPINLLGMYKGIILNKNFFFYLSLFYMVNIPKNMFPTSCSRRKCQGGGPTGHYEEGKPYAYISSWKFNTFNMNCGSNECPNRGTYGEHHMVPHIKKNNYGPAPGLIIKAENTGGAVGSGIDSNTNLD